MSQSLLVTKFYVPPRRAKAIARPELIRRLEESLQNDQGFHRRLTLVSAAPGFGKTSLVAEWLCGQASPVSWLSLDEKDADPVRFLTYLVSAMQHAGFPVGEGLSDALQAPEPPVLTSVLTGLVNELSLLAGRAYLVLDDYHSVTSHPIDALVHFLIENGPPQIHLVLITREDPGFSLADLRAKGRLFELRARDLKFSPAEVELFFRSSLALSLTDEEVEELGSRSEGWAAGLQIAALALQGKSDAKSQAESVAAFTGNHRFVLDYFVEEVLSQQTPATLSFLVTTALLGRFCAPLCDEVLELPAGTAESMLDSLERSNLFLVPLDGDRRWYRYHNLFADILQHRLSHSANVSYPEPAVLHRRASDWFDRNQYSVEAFRQATLSGDVPRAETLISDAKMQTFTREVFVEVTDWLAGLPPEVKDARPSLWVRSATLSLMAGITAGVEERLQHAEAALRVPPAEIRLLRGQIAGARAALAITQYRMESAMEHAQQALETLPEGPSAARLGALYFLGTAYQQTGRRQEAREILRTVLPTARAVGATFLRVLTQIALGEIEEHFCRLHLAQENYHQAIELSARHPQPGVCEAYLGLARIHYQWNQRSVARSYAEQALALALQYDRAIDRHVLCEVFLAKNEMSEGNFEEARRQLLEAQESALKHRFDHRLTEIASGQAALQLKMGQLPDPAGTSVPMQIRILLEQKDFDQASKLTHSWVEQVRDQKEEWLPTEILLALVQHGCGNTEAALDILQSVFLVTRPEGYLRVFTDEGMLMHQLVSIAWARGIAPEYTQKILATFDSGSPPDPSRRPVGALLSLREQDVLHQMAEGRSNEQIAEKLFLSPHTVKVHIRNIFAKLFVSSRTSAVAKARSLGLLG